MSESSKGSGKRVKGTDSASMERIQKEKEAQKAQILINLKHLLHKSEDKLELFASKFISDKFISKKIPDFHKEIYELISELKGFLLIVAPRAHAKTTVCSKIFPIWCAMYGKRKSIAIVSASLDMAMDILRDIKLELENNPIFKTIKWDYKTDKWSAQHIQVKSLKGELVDIKAIGAGGQIRGRRPDLVIMDDIESDENVESPDQRRKLQNWLNKAVIGTLLPDGQLIMVGTILHRDSLLNNILINPIGWQTLFYQAYIDEVEDENHVLWTEQWSHKALQERKLKQGSHAFAQEYLNNPSADEDLPIKKHHIRYWETLPNELSYVISVDPAYTEDKSSDYKVASLIGIDSNKNRYLVSYIRTHNPTGEYINGFINLYLQHKNRITGVGIPCAGTEREFYNSVLRQCEVRKVYPPIVEVKNVFRTATDRTYRKKKDRIVASLQPLFEAGKYYINRNHVEAEDELLSIGISKHDDLVDTLAYAEQFIDCGYIEQNTQEYDSLGDPVTVSGVKNYGYE